MGEGGRLCGCSVDLRDVWVGAVSTAIERGEAVGDLVCCYDGDVMFSREISEELS